MRQGADEAEGERRARGSSPRAVVLREGQERRLGRQPPAHERAQEPEERLRQIEHPRALVGEHEAEGEDAVDETPRGSETT